MFHFSNSGAVNAVYSDCVSKHLLKCSPPHKKLFILSGHVSRATQSLPVSNSAMQQADGAGNTISTNSIVVTLDIALANEAPVSAIVQQLFNISIPGHSKYRPMPQQRLPSPHPYLY